MTQWDAWKNLQSEYSRGFTDAKIIKKKGKKYLSSLDRIQSSAKFQPANYQYGFKDGGGKINGMDI